MLAKFSLPNVIFLALIISVLFAIDPVVEAFYRYHFRTTILTNNPSAAFELMFPATRLQSDKDFLTGIWIFVLLMQLVAIYQDYRLWRIKQAAQPSRKKMFSVFLSRIIASAFILMVLPVNLIVFDKSYAAVISFTDKLILGCLIGVMINSLALLPYLAQRNIGTFFKLGDILIFNIGMLLMLAILIWLGVSQYAAPAIAAAISGLPFIKKIMDSWKLAEDFFGIRDKRIYEMF